MQCILNLLLIDVTVPNTLCVACLLCQLTTRVTIQTNERHVRPALRMEHMQAVN